jgi:hypothetical protein
LKAVSGVFCLYRSDTFRLSFGNPGDGEVGVSDGIDGFSGFSPVQFFSALDIEQLRTGFSSIPHWISSNSALDLAQFRTGYRATPHWI